MTREACEWFSLHARCVTLRAQLWCTATRHADAWKDSGRDSETAARVSANPVQVPALRGRWYIYSQWTTASIHGVPFCLYVRPPVSRKSHAAFAVACFVASVDAVLQSCCWFESCNLPTSMAANRTKHQQHHSLGKTLAVDCASATAASFALAPFITAVDISIVRNVNGSMKLWDSMGILMKEVITRPHRFLTRRDFLVVWLLYAGTYGTANITKTVCRNWNQISSIFSSKSKGPARISPSTTTASAAVNPAKVPGSISDIIPTQITTTGFNMSVCIYKDRLFTQWFGTRAASKVPLSALSLWAIRDSLTVGAAFTIVEPVGKLISDSTNISRRNGNMLSQLLCPIGIQYVSTPLHLLGLDLYNNPASSLGGRAKLIGREYFKSVFARQMRIGFAFGIGGVGNRYIHEKLSHMTGQHSWST